MYPSVPFLEASCFREGPEGEMEGEMDELDWENLGMILLLVALYKFWLAALPQGL